MKNTPFSSMQWLMLRSSAAILCILTIGSARISAQNSIARHHISINAGLSMVNSSNLGITTFIEGDGYISDRSDFKRYPAIQLNYDYAILRWLSAGAALSTQIFRTEYSVYKGTPGLAIYLNEYTFSHTDTRQLYRNNVALRILFHYVNTKRVDAYSGLRAGYTFWRESRSNSESDLIIRTMYATDILPQLVLFGCRVYFTDHFGVNSELCLGSPHYLSAGFNYRF